MKFYQLPQFPRRVYMQEEGKGEIQILSLAVLKKLKIEPSQDPNDVVTLFFHCQHQETVYFPVGLLPIINQVAKETGIRVSETKTLPVNYDTKAQDIIHKDMLDGITLRDYQVQGSVAGLYYKSGMIQVPTGGGKTEMISCCTKYNLEHTDKKILIGVPSVKLLTQLHKRLLKRGLPENEISMMGGGNKYDPNSRVIVSTVISAFNAIENGDETFTKWSKDIGTIMLDECFPGGTLVKLPNNRCATIEEIYNNPHIQYVVSYNLSTESYEIKKIVRKIKLVPESKEFFWRLYYNDPIGGVERSLTATPNHKIWTKNRGYVRLDELVKGDLIKIDTSEDNYSYVCKYCGRTFDESTSLGGHVNLVHCNAGKIHAKVSSLSKRDVFKKCMESRSNNNAYREYLSDRMIKDNPMHSDDVRKKVSESIKTRRLSNKSYRESSLRNFMQAPRRGRTLLKKFGMTSLERHIESLGIQGLTYTGNGSYWLKLGTKNKNPDFIYKNGDEIKFVEISDTEYWYSQEDINRLVSLYEENGHQILYLTDKDVLDINLKGRIEKFLFNHHVEVLKVRKNVGKPIAVKYNLEVEGNHNYFAESVLVSNCHHGSARTWFSLVDNLQCPSVLGFSAEPFYGDDEHIVKDMLLRGTIGSTVYRIPLQVLIKRGYLSQPVVYAVQTSCDQSITHLRDWHQVNSKGIINNKPRNQMIKDLAQLLIGIKWNPLILVSQLNHGRELSKLVSQGSRRVAFLSGGNSVEIYQDGMMTDNYPDPEELTLQEFEKGYIDAIIGTSVLDEGVDLPSLRSIILAGGGKSKLKLIQRMGRGLRPKEVDNRTFIIDFVDGFNRVTKNQFNERKQKGYDSNEFPVYYVESLNAFRYMLGLS